MLLEEQMFAAWLPVLGVSPGVWLALNRQLWAVGVMGSPCLPGLLLQEDQELFGLGIS